MKLSRVEDEAVAIPGLTRQLPTEVTVEELQDYSLRVTLPDSIIRGGFVAVFRDPTHEDLEFLEAQMASCKTKQEAMRRFGVRCCIEWQGKPGATMQDWGGLRAKASLELMAALNKFFPEPEAV
jgi:hypothetical protein